MRTNNEEESNQNPLFAYFGSVQPTSIDELFVKTFDRAAERDGNVWRMKLSNGTAIMLTLRFGGFEKFQEVFEGFENAFYPFHLDEYVELLKNTSYCPKLARELEYWLEFSIDNVTDSKDLEKLRDSLIDSERGFAVGLEDLRLTVRLPSGGVTSEFLHDLEYEANDDNFEVENLVEDYEGSTGANIWITDRNGLKSGFQSRRRFLLLSIRRPGTRPACVENNWAILSRCDLMLHEWDIDNPPFPLPPVSLTARRASKIAHWLHRHQHILASGEVDLVIQSESASSQLAAISNTIENYLNGIIKNRDSAPPHRDTQVLLEMAFASLSLIEPKIDTATQVDPAKSVRATLDATAQLFSLFNINFIFSTQQAPFFVEDPVAAHVAAYSVLNSIVDDLEITNHSAGVSNFIANVLFCRGAQGFKTPEDLKLCAKADVNCPFTSTLIIGASQSSAALDLLEVTNSVHLIFPRQVSFDDWKSELLRKNIWLLETSVGENRIFSISQSPSFQCQILHRRLRS